MAVGDEDDLRQLALQRGVSFVVSKTRAEASRAIDALKHPRPEPVADRRREIRAVEDDRPASAATPPGLSRASKPTDGNLSALDAVISADYVLHDPGSPQEVRGVDGLKEMVETYRSGVPDLRVTIEHQFTEGDYVATRFTARGTHEGEIMGVAPTGRDVTIRGLTISRCRDGKIVEEWEVSDIFGLLQQIGALPEAIVS